MEQVKEKKLTLFNVLFGKNNEYVTSDDTYTTYIESSYIKGLKSNTEEAITRKEDKKSSKNGGFTAKVDTPEINEETLKKMRNKLGKDRDDEKTK